MSLISINTQRRSDYMWKQCTNRKLYVYLSPYHHSSWWYY